MIQYAKVFTEHPAAVGMTYFEHMKLSAQLSWCFMCASATAAVHAIAPCLFQTSSTDAIIHIRTLIIHTNKKT